jgi:hypothetical protein
MISGRRYIFLFLSFQYNSLLIESNDPVSPGSTKMRFGSSVCRPLSRQDRIISMITYCNKT